MSHEYLLLDILHMLHDQPRDAPVVLSTSEYGRVKQQVEEQCGEELEALTRIAGHPIRVVRELPRVKTWVTEIDQEGGGDA